MNETKKTDLNPTRHPRPRGLRWNWKTAFAVLHSPLRQNKSQKLKSTNGCRLTMM